MRYPAYLHIGDETRAHCVTIPDFPGCFPAADHWEDLPRTIQEAAEIYLAGADMAIPSPTPLEHLMNKRDYRGGVWMMVQIDVDRLPRSAESDLPRASTGGDGDFQCRGNL